MPNLTTLPEEDKLTKNNHLILNLAGLEYPGMYNRFNILYLEWLPQGPSLFLHIPYLIILSDEQVRRQSAAAAKQIILYNDELIINNYVKSNVNSHYFIYFYSEVIEKYKKQIQTILLVDKDQPTRRIIFNIIDAIFEDTNFLIKIYLFIYRKTASIPQAQLEDKENNIDAIVVMLKPDLDNIFERINFSNLEAFKLPKFPLAYPPELLPPPLDISELGSANPDINPETLRLLCPYRMPVPTTTPDRFLTLLTSPVY
jgi:hypothetical protein